ncbi:aminopeptidase O isoform X4 [Narcine bancroftii]|uniref:aminopeptidase O isoform X4 n=1 Tax=Narcine bancroftii TaxID=1343680 RepID=UPI00383132E0
MNESTESVLDPNKDDLPLMANTNYMLVRHYVLDLAINFDREVISGTVVLFLETSKVHKKASSSSGMDQHPSWEGLFENEQSGSSCSVSYACKDKMSNLANHSDGRVTNVNNCNHSNNEWARGISGTREHCGNGKDFVLVLDCCNLVVNKVEEVNVIAAEGIEKLIRMDVLKREDGIYSPGLQNDLQSSILDEILGLAAEHWQEQHNYFIQCSEAPGCGELEFQTDMWSLKIKKPGIQSPKDFPRVLRIWYETKPEGGSVKWTKDQCGRPCVYTAGSPINNRALFPCQEPPVAMATWQASIWAPKDSVVLLSGENCAKPHQNGALSKWFYYVTMLMPASTFTLAVGYWLEVKDECTFNHPLQSPLFSKFINENCRVSMTTCGHPPYPCHFQNPVVQVQDCIPHRVFAPDCLKLRSQEFLLPLVAQCLSAASCVLGTHPFCRVDVLIVPHSFSSLGMARPNKENTGVVSNSGGTIVKHGRNPGKNFMQVHYLKGYFLLYYLENQVGQKIFLKFLGRFVEKFHGQLILSEDFLQMFMENFPQLESQGLSVEAIYQVWLDVAGLPKPLLSDAVKWTESRLVRQVQNEVTKWAGIDQRVRKGSRKRQRGCKDKVTFRELLPDQLVLLLEFLLEMKSVSSQTLQRLQKQYCLREQDAEVRHRWCELVIKNKLTVAYGDLVNFLKQDQAMGIYLYGELMINEDARQQQLAHRCFTMLKEEMDPTLQKVVAEMLL